MFDDVELIQWSEIHGPYGTVGEMPRRLYDAASSDSAVAGTARDWIWNNIIHQGTRWQSTAPTIPFLFELLRVPTASGRPEIAWGLHGWAVDEVIPLFPRGFDVDATFSRARETTLDAHEITEIWNTPDWDRLTAHQMVVVEQMPARWHFDAYLAVERQLTENLDLLADVDRLVRMAFCRAPAYFPRIAAPMLPLLRSAAEKDAESVHLATVAMSLGFAGKYAKDYRDVSLLESLLQSDSQIVRIMAALALGVLLESAIPTNAADVLVDFTAEDLTVVGDCTRSLRLQSSLLGYVWQMLHALGL